MIKRGDPFWKIFRHRLFFSIILFGAAFIFIHFLLPNVRPTSAVLIMDNVAERQLLRIRKNIEAGPVESLSLHIQGHLNGTAIIRIFETRNESKFYQEQLIGSGKVDTKLGGAWQSDDCRIEYDPKSARQGELKIVYNFKTRGGQSQNALTPSAKSAA